MDSLISETQIAIIGGGTGGCAAAIAAAKLGKNVILTEEYDWLGGQLTSQAVPPDEHPWIEKFGCTLSYRRFRNRVRARYQNHSQISREAADNDLLNPGSGWVSRLCFDPRVGVSVLKEMLAPYVQSGQIHIWKGYVPIAADKDSDSIRSVTVRNIHNGEIRTLTAEYFLDATELGDLLKLSGTEYVSGAESRDETGEPNAAEKGDENDVQGFTWCFAMGYDPDGKHTIEKPAQYDYWKNYVPELTPPWPGKLLDWTVSNPITWKTSTYKLFGKLGMFSYRQIVDKTVFDSTTLSVNDATIVNWAQNDCFLRVIDQPDDVVKANLEASRQLSLSCLYWLQTEAARDEGGYGYPELYPSGELTGTPDGLAMAPYHRESRRIRAMFTVTENHVGVDARPGKDFSENFEDSVGIGAYRIDLHPSASGRNSIDVSCYPFQIPLGSLIPVRMKNLLPACKNLGVTHITNGCYRLHPVEWNIGEAAAILASYCLDRDTTPHGVYESKEIREDYQALLQSQGVEINWPKLRAM